jgi:hypothetical protein
MANKVNKVIRHTLGEKIVNLYAYCTCTVQQIVDQSADIFSSEELSSIRD